MFYFLNRVLTNPRKTHKPIDIIECRHKVHLFNYFNKFSLEERKYFKHSRKLLLSRYINLSKEQREELEYILINYSEEFI